MMNARNIGFLLLIGAAISLSSCVHYEKASPDYHVYDPGVPTPWADLPPIFDHWTIDSRDYIKP